MEEIIPQKALGEQPLLTIPKAASALGVPVYTLRRAVKGGLVPSYQPFSSRVLVRLSEIQAVVTASGNGGSGDE